MSGAPLPGSRPLIGVTSSERRRREHVQRRPQGEPAHQTELALGLSYLAAITRAGGLPVILGPVMDPDLRPLLERLDGLVLSGGPDLDPRTYGHMPHRELGPTEPQVDAFEIALASAAVRLHVPVLGICRGMQVLNVAGGGTLHQHLPEVAGGSVTHRSRETEATAMHDVGVTASSRLGVILGTAQARVNSFHHQAIDRLAPSLVVTAQAPDGVIEAVEGRGPGWLVGVQWHAESLDDDPGHSALFGALMSASVAHREHRADLSLLGSVAS